MDAGKEEVDGEGGEVGEMIFGANDVNSVVEEGEMVFGVSACDVGWDRGEVGDENENVHKEEGCSVEVVGFVVGSFEFAKE